MRPETSKSGPGSESTGRSPKQEPNQGAGRSDGNSITISRLLTPERTRARVTAASRKRALEHGCEILAGDELNAREMLDALLARERLGSTALGDGVAIPHCRLSGCTSPMGVLITLDSPVDYDAPDDGDVDLLFMLVVPDGANDEHLLLLSALAGVFVEGANRQALRDARDHLTLFETMQRLSQNT